MMRHLCARLVAAALGLLLALVISTNAIQAAGPGVVAGRLWNGTAGGATPAGAEVYLGVFRGDAFVGETTTRADSAGLYRFEGLEVGGDVTYEVAVAYQGGIYYTESLTLTAETPEQQADVRVFDAVQTDPGLRAERVLFIVGSVDVERQEMVIGELVTLTNPSDRTFVPGSSGPQGIVRFGLPAGARDIRAGLGLSDDEIIQVDRGFGSLGPIRPGTHEFGFSYRLPYAAGQASLEKSLPYGAATFQVLVPEGGPELVGSDLAPIDPVTLSAGSLRAWAGRELPPGTRLTLPFDGLPSRPLWGAALDLAQHPLVAPALLAVVLGLGVLGVVWRQSRRPTPSPTPLEEADASAAVDADSSLAELANLDDAYGAGEVPESEYRERRAVLKEQVRARLSVGGRQP